MTTITLHKYHEQINQLLDSHQYDLAVDHCRHILQQQPQHVATYRLLAKTLLEKGEYDGARELFQRVLSADPNDHIAHAGLAVIFKEEEVLSQAIWHLERAYEIEPYNAAIQQELRSLYSTQSEYLRRGQKNGDTAVIPTTLLLTKGALARLYLRGELYDQATAVLRAALDADEERVDLRVLLMEALWRDGRRMEAVNVALQVLDQLPSCITANAVLAEIWLRTGRVDEAQSYLQRLQNMLLLDTDHFDPEAPEGTAFRAEGAIPLPKVVELDYLGDDGAMLAFEEKASWAPGEAAADRAETDTGDMYQWLEGLTGELPSLPETEPDTDWTTSEDLALAAAGERTETTKPQSDWLAALSNEDEDEEQESDFEMLTGSVQSENKPDTSFTDLFAEDAEEADWLSDLEDGPQSMAAPPEAEVLPPVVEKADDFTPDWLADLAGDDLEPMEIDSQTAAAWLRENEDVNEDKDSAETDEYNWLDTPFDERPRSAAESEAGELDLSQFGEFEFEPEEPEEPEEFEWRLTDELNALSRGTGDWDESDEAESEADAELVGASVSEEIPADVPDWLMTGSATGDLYDDGQPAEDELAQELAGWVAANSPELPVEDASFDWALDDVEVEEKTAVSSQSSEESNPLDSGELPDWLGSDFSPDTVDSRILGTDHLDEEAANADDDELAENLVGGELPSWLEKEAAPAEKEQEPSATSDLPDWLMGASLDSYESAPLDETKVTGAISEEPETVFQDEFSAADEAPDLETSETSDMLRAAAELDLSTQEELAAAEDLPAWLFADEEPAKTSMAAGPDMDVEVEEVVSDEQDEKITGPVDEEDTQPELTLPPDEELDWLDDLAEVSGTETGVEILNDTGELPDWMLMDEQELADAEAAKTEARDTAVSDQPLDEADSNAFPVVSLEEEADLDWLDALAAENASPEPVEELPTWQWPEDEAAPEELSDEAVETMMALEVDELEVEALAGIGTGEFPDDLDDAMSWLEELAGEPDAPVEELPTVAQDPDLDFLFAAEELTDTQAESLPAEAFDLPPEDPEAAMAWLEQLAARQGAPLDELPSVTADAAAAEQETSEAIDSLALEGLELEEVDFAGVEATLFAADLADLEEEGETAVSADDFSLDVPDDPDEAMAWLEQLAARQGAPLDELPSITDKNRPEQFAPDADELEFDFLAVSASLEAEEGEESAGLEPEVEADALDDLDEAMAWLSELEEEGEGDTAVDDWFQTEETTIESSPQPAISPALLQELDWLEAAASLPTGSSDAAEFDMEEMEISDEELAAALDQLDVLARMPSPRPSEADKLPVQPSDFADELDEWFDETEDDLADESDESQASLTAVIVEETVVIAEGLDTLDELPEDEPDLDLDAIPDDPDEAMAWLERLAARQGASLDELPSLYDADEETLASLTAVPEAPAPKAVEEVKEAAEPDVPESIEDAMAWLEQLAARQGASLDELPSVSSTSEEIDTPDWIVAAQTAGETESEPSPEPDEDIDDFNWTTASLQESSSAAETETDSAAGEDVPENIEDAMAWLEKLAARQGASLDELPSVTGETAVDDDLAAPAWIEAARAAALAEESEEGLEEVEAEGQTANDWSDAFWDQDTSDTDVLTAVASLTTDEPLDLSSLDDDNLGLEDDDSLPDWLTTESEENYPRVVGHTDWLGTLPEPDLDGWLAAEEEATTIGTTLSETDTSSLGRAADKTGPLTPKAETGPLNERFLQETADFEDELLIPDMDLGLSAVELDMERLNSARSALDSGEFAAALDDYASLVEKGEGLNTLIADLEAASGRYSDRPLLRRMLGDAYMRNGQLHRALETYRQALDQM